MNRIWANRLIAGTQTWADCPTTRKVAVEVILRDDVINGRITEEQLNAIINPD